jgi:hypothetical protein
MNDSQPTPPAPGQDINASLNYLAALHGSQPFDLVSIIPDGPLNWARFVLDERDAAGEWLQARNATANVYYHVNSPYRTPAQGKARKDDIEFIRYAHVDLDFADLHPDLNWRDPAALQSATSEALAKIASFAVPPTFVVFSGGGLHILWRFSQPIAAKNTMIVDRCEMLNAALAYHFAAEPKTRNIDRILRVPGTFNHPDAKKRKLGREISAATTITCETGRVADGKDLLLAVGVETVQRAEQLFNGGSGKPQSHSAWVSPQDIDAWINGIDETTTALLTSEAHGGVDRSKVCWSIIWRLLARQVPDDVIVACRVKFPQGPFAHYTSERRLREDLARAHKRYRTTRHTTTPNAVPHVSPDEPPLPAVRGVGDGLAYPVHALGPYLAAAARAMQCKTQTPMALCAATALGAANLMAQQHVNLRLPHALRPISLMQLAIGESGERKTTVHDIAFAPVRAYERKWFMQVREANQQFMIAKGLYDSGAKAILGDKKLSPDARRAKFDELGPAPMPPPQAGILMDDTTIEGLYRQLERGRASQGLCSSEGGKFLGSHAMSDASLMRTLSGLSGLWDDGYYSAYRADTDHNYHVNGRRLAVCLMAQETVAQRLIGSKLAEEQGLLSRFLVSKPTSTIGSRQNQNLHESGSLFEGMSDHDFINVQVERFHEVIRYGLEAAINLDETGAITVRALPLDGEALLAYQKFTDQLESSMAIGGENDNLRGFTSKAAEHAGRIAATLQVYDALAADWVTDYWVDDGAEVKITLPEAIDLEHTERGIELAQYYIGEARRLFGHGEADEESANAAKLEKWLLEKQQTEVTLVEIYRNVWGLPTARAARAAAAVLIENGRLQPLDGGLMYKGNKRREAYKVIL